MTPFRELSRDPVLRKLIRAVGEPDPFVWPDGGRTGGDNFAALVLHIVGQQISTAVAFTLFDRIRDALGELPSPAGILALGPDKLRGFGLSRAKASYLAALAESPLDIYHMDHLTDAEAVTALTAIRGLGPWTAEMFLVHQLHRTDVLPAGDVGIRRAIERAWRLDALPSVPATRQRAAAWSPNRTFAAALLWASLSV